MFSDTSKHMVSYINHACEKERQNSLQCLNSNMGDKEICAKYIQNVKECKAFWADVIKDRKSKGHENNGIPSYAETETVKAEYMAKKKEHYKEVLIRREQFLREQGWKTRAEKAAEEAEIKRLEEEAERDKNNKKETS